MWPECEHKSALWDDSIFSIAFFSKNRMIPQTTFVLTFRPHIISELGGVHSVLIFIKWQLNIPSQSIPIQLLFQPKLKVQSK